MARLKIGVTGSHGFIGSHLYNSLSLLKNEFVLVPFEKNFFEDDRLLDQWVEECDVVIHLAAMNRHPDTQVIYNTNIKLVALLVKSFERTQHTPHVLFSSSLQEERDNPYGLSKKIGRELFSRWAESAGGIFTGLIIPNVFGPFCLPFYNSVVATFCSQLCSGQEPAIDVDSDLHLIYVQELIDVIITSIRNRDNNHFKVVASTYRLKVSELLSVLTNYRNSYFFDGIIPDLQDSFSINLFNTFRSYIDYNDHFPFVVKKHEDERGFFSELIKLNIGGQVSFSTTKPGITRGNHFHTRKIERFIVIKGRAEIQLRKYNSDKVYSFVLDGKKPAYVDMPVWYTHNIRNIGDTDLYTIFWINEFYDATDPDTYLEKV